MAHAQACGYTPTYSGRQASRQGLGRVPKVRVREEGKTTNRTRSMEQARQAGGVPGQGFMKACSANALQHQCNNGWMGWG